MVKVDPTEKQMWANVRSVVVGPAICHRNRLPVGRQMPSLFLSRNVDLFPEQLFHRQLLDNHVLRKRLLEQLRCGGGWGYNKLTTQLRCPHPSVRPALPHLQATQRAGDLHQRHVFFDLHGVGGILDVRPGRGLFEVLSGVVYNAVICGGVYKALL